MCLSLYLNFHNITTTKPTDLNACPQGLVVWHPPVEISNHSVLCLVVKASMVEVNLKHLLPPFSSSLLQDVLDVDGSLVDLVIEIFEENSVGV